MVDYFLELNIFKNWRVMDALNVHGDFLSQLGVYPGDKIDKVVYRKMTDSEFLKIEAEVLEYWELKRKLQEIEEQQKFRKEQIEKNNRDIEQMYARFPDLRAELENPVHVDSKPPKTLSSPGPTRQVRRVEPKPKFQVSETNINSITVEFAKIMGGSPQTADLKPFIRRWTKEKGCFLRVMENNQLSIISADPFIEYFKLHKIKKCNLGECTVFTRREELSHALLNGDVVLEKLSIGFKVFDTEQQTLSNFATAEKIKGINIEFKDKETKKIYRNFVGDIHNTSIKDRISNFLGF